MVFINSRVVKVYAINCLSFTFTIIKRLSPVCSQSFNTQKTLKLNRISRFPRHPFHVWKKRCPNITKPDLATANSFHSAAAGDYCPWSYFDFCRPSRGYLTLECCYMVAEAFVGGRFHYSCLRWSLKVNRLASVDCLMLPSRYYCHHLHFQR